MSTLKPILLAVAVATAATLTTGAAAAQAMGAGAGPAIPAGMDLAKIPVGSWSEYTVSMQGQTMKQRFALVGRSPEGHVVEMSVSGGAMAMAGGSLAVRVDLDPNPAAAKRVKRMIMQMGPADPVEMPLNEAEMPQNQFAPPDDNKLVGTETIKVAAGSFKTKHYRDKNPDGQPMDFWIAEDVPPFGLVRMRMNVDGGKGAQVVNMELSGRGTGAKPTITKPAKPFDQAAMMQQLMQNMQQQGAGGPGGPGARPAKAAKKTKPKQP